MPATRVGVVVLGDLGRSPRMQYHVQSLASHGYEVDMIGYDGSHLPSAITENRNIRVKFIRPVPVWFAKLPKLLAYLMKSIWQALFLLFSLPLFSHLSYILVQTPPGIPTLPTLWIYSAIKGTQLIIDWHNYSHTILSLALPPAHPLVNLTKVVEKIFGQMASNNFCVTKAMKEDLSSNWGVEAHVLYDRPPEKFKPITAIEKQKLFSNLAEKYPAFNDVCENTGVVVSSTSWTEDEDFAILLDALVDYEKMCESNSLCKLLVVITGKGPMKQFYIDEVNNMNFKFVQVVTPWLETEVYPTMLASADLGVCLHTSSSGLDLPMKVVDMFGCGLPVAAIHFKALDELVQDGENGKIFKNSAELSDILKLWFGGSNELRSKFSKNLEDFRNLRWDTNWDNIALPAFKLRKDPNSSTSGMIMFCFFAALFLSLFSFVPTVQ